MITQSELKLLFNYDANTGVFTRLTSTAPNARIGDVISNPNGQGYIELRVKYKTYQAHRMAWLYIHGINPPEQIDHINRCRNDNRISNLRCVTSQQNSRNRSASINKFGVIGLSWCNKSKKFYSRITINRKTKYLGYFYNMFDAVCARKSAENKYFNNQ